VFKTRAAGGRRKDCIGFAAEVGVSDETRLNQTTPDVPVEEHLPHAGPIPGERDPDNLIARQPGAMSGQFAGSDIPATDHQNWLDDVTATEHAREGGSRKR
jgi:hypothetical protein